MLKKGKAMAVAKEILSEKYTDEEKAAAIYVVMNMATHNCISKADFLEIIKYLWHQLYEYVESDEE